MSQDKEATPLLIGRCVGLCTILASWCFLALAVWLWYGALFLMD